MKEIWIKCRRDLAFHFQQKTSSCPSPSLACFTMSRRPRSSAGALHVGEKNTTIKGKILGNLPLKAWLQCYKHIHQFCRFSIAYSWNDEKRLRVHHKILSTEYHLRIVPRNTQAKETRSTAMKVWSQDSFQPISVMFSF